MGLMMAAPGRTAPGAARGPALARSFTRAAMEAPLLDREEERALALRWRRHGEEAALHRLTRAHMRLAVALAARFRRYGLPVADLVQEGHVGLLEAAARFDPDRNVRFSTYATWWMRAAMQDYVLRNWSVVRCGTSAAQKALFFNLRRLKARLARSLGPEADGPAVQREVARTLGVAEAEVAAMDARLAVPVLSLDAPLRPGGEEPGESRGDTLADPGPPPDEAAAFALDGARRARWLAEALAVLSERERHVLRERRLTDEAATLESLGGDLGISKERVRQIESRALEKLRAELVARHGRAFDAA